MKTSKFLTFLVVISLPLQVLALFGGQNKKERTALLEYEKNTVQTYQDNARSVVNVSNIKIARGHWLFDYDVSKVPAGAGSGFVWDKKGHIITNYHVIANGDEFFVTFHKDKKQYKAKLIGKEPSKDIAVLKLINPPKSLYPVKLFNSKKLKVGQKAMAIGSPFGLDQTITAGIISALGREIQGVAGIKIQGMIQTDSSINPGNSGGPLYDSAGQVIGMNTMIYSNSGSSAGIGFAVPSNTIARIAPQLIKHGKVIRPSIGFYPLEDHIKNYMGIEKGIVIRSIMANSPAEKAGLQGIRQDRFGRKYYLGDVITHIDHHEINSYEDIFITLDKYKIGQKVEITYLREDKKKKVSLRLMRSSSK